MFKEHVKYSTLLSSVQWLRALGHALEHAYNGK